MERKYFFFPKMRLVVRGQSVPDEVEGFVRANFKLLRG